MVVFLAHATAQPEATDQVRLNPAPPWFDTVLRRAMSNSAGAEEIARQELTDARQSRNEIAEAYALLAVAFARGRQNDMPQSGQLAAEALAIAERVNDRMLLLEARNLRVNSYRATDDFAPAMELALQNLQDAERLGLRRFEYLALFELAICHAGLGDPQAMELAMRAMHCAEQLANPAGIAASAELVGGFHFDAGRFAEARSHLQRALALREELGNRTAVADVQERLARIAYKEGDAAGALRIIAALEPQRRSLRGRVKLTNLLLFKAEVLTALRQLPEALACVEEARVYADAIEAEGLAISVLSTTALVHEARGEHESALAATRKAFALELKLAGEKTRRRVAELQTRYDVARKDEDLRRLARDNERFASEAKLREAQLARNAAELRANAAELTRTRWQRLGLALVLGAGAVTLGAIVLAQRSRLRAEQRVLAESRRARTAAEEAAALKSQIVGIASHDLKAPLRAIRTRAAQLESSPASPAEHAAALAQIRFDSDRMLTLIRDLLDMSAAEGGHLVLARAPAELNTVVADAIGPQRVLAQRKGVQLEFAPAPDPLTLQIDAARLAQAVGNLVDNAVKFTPAAGRVRVTVSRTDEEALVAVADDGPGLQPADFARMFQPFQTLSAAPTGGESSTGLGLHIAREIVTRHGGRLEVDSQPGRGATFTLRVPLA